MGVLVLEEEDEKGLDLGVYGIYVTVVAWIMVGIGCLYFLMVRSRITVAPHQTSPPICFCTYRPGDRNQPI